MGKFFGFIARSKENDVLDYFSISYEVVTIQQGET